MSVKEPTIRELKAMREEIDAKLKQLLAKRNDAMTSIARVMHKFDISVQELSEFLIQHKELEVKMSHSGAVERKVDPDKQPGARLNATTSSPSVSATKSEAVAPEVDATAANSHDSDELDILQPHFVENQNEANLPPNIR